MEKRNASWAGDVIEKQIAGQRIRTNRCAKDNTNIMLKIQAQCKCMLKIQAHIMYA